MLAEADIVLTKRLICSTTQSRALRHQLQTQLLRLIQVHHAVPSLLDNMIHELGRKAADAIKLLDGIAPPVRLLWRHIRCGRNSNIWVNKK